MIERVRHLRPVHALAKPPLATGGRRRGGGGTVATAPPLV